MGGPGMGGGMDPYGQMGGGLGNSYFNDVNVYQQAGTMGMQDPMLFGGMPGMNFGPDNCMNFDMSDHINSQSPQQKSKKKSKKYIESSSDSSTDSEMESLKNAYQSKF